MTASPPSTLPRLRALLASARIANVPSAISNVMLGYLLGYFYWDGASATDWSGIGALALAAACLLVAGNLANDWFDRAWDATHRPERALPSGMLPPGLYAALATALSAAALAAAGTLGPRPLAAAGLILVCIGLYTWTHKRSRLAVIPMGLCRAGLYLMGFLCFWPGESLIDPSQMIALSPPAPFATWELFHKSRAVVLLATHALGLFTFVAGLTLAARLESLANPPAGGRFVTRAMLFLPLAAMSAWWIPYYPLAGALALVPFAIWLGLALTILRRPVSRFVSALLAGIPLVDLIAAVPLATGLQFLELAAPPLTAVAVVVPPAAFVLGLALQKIAPAT